MTLWVFIGLGIGIFVGLVAPAEWSVALKPMGTLFIRLIKMVVAPLVFASLVSGLVGAGHGSIGRLLLKALLWFWLATAVAIVMGLGAAAIFQPGAGVSAPAGIDTHSNLVSAAVHKPFWEQIVPESIFQALAANSLLQILFFAILFALGLSAIGEKNRPVIEFLDATTAAMFKVTSYVMYFAPVGVGCAMAAAIGANGIGIMSQLARLVGSLYFALGMFVICLLSMVKLYTRIRLRTALRALEEPLTLAFSTTSSESALPKAIESMIRLGVPPHIVNFVIPAGYSFNLDGTTLYLSLASMFIAQAAGIHITVGGQIVMMLTLLLTSKGVAAVPRASLIVLSATCTSFGLPAEYITLILGVDALMDMARTTVNVLGNCMASVVIAKWEGLLPSSSAIYGQPSPLVQKRRRNPQPDIL